MKKISLIMTGAPWHVEFLKKEEGDTRRHKMRCKYYKNDSCSHCMTKCCGSAHCIYYCEIRGKQEPRKRINKKIGEDDCCYYTTVVNL